MGLVVMVCRFEVLRPRKKVRQLRWVVDQHGKVLRTDPEIRVLVLESDERDLRRGPAAYETPG